MLNNKHIFNTMFITNPLFSKPLL